MPITYATIGSDPELMYLYAIDTDAITPHHPMDHTEIALWAALLWADRKSNIRPQYSAINSHAVFMPKRAIRLVDEARDSLSVAFSLITPDHDTLLCDHFDPDRDGIEDLSHLIGTCALTNAYADDTQPQPIINTQALERLTRTLQPDHKGGHLIEELRFESVVGLALLQQMLRDHPHASFPTETAFNLVLEVATTERRRHLGIARTGDGFTTYLLHDLFSPGLVRWTQPNADRCFALDQDLLTKLLDKAPEAWITTGQRLAAPIAQAHQEVVWAAVAHIARTDSEIKRAPLVPQAVPAHQTLAGCRLVAQLQDAVRTSLS